MQKIKQLFRFVFSKETLTTIIYLQVILLLLITISGNLTIKLDNVWGSFDINVANKSYSPVLLKLQTEEFSPVHLKLETESFDPVHVRVRD